MAISLLTIKTRRSIKVVSSSASGSCFNSRTQLPVLPELRKLSMTCLPTYPKLTTADVNRILYRQFGTRIHRGTVSWNGETIQLRPEVTEQLRQNYLASRGIHPAAHSATNKNPLPPQGDNRGNDIHVRDPANAGATDTNREWELNGSMDLSVDDEAAQRRKWRR